jgi:hypothetical protein
LGFLRALPKAWRRRGIATRWKLKLVVKDPGYKGDIGSSSKRLTWVDNQTLFITLHQGMDVDVWSGAEC